MKQDTVLYENNQGIAVITLNRPHVKNALHLPMHEELYYCLNEANTDTNVKVIVLQGAGDAFCAGADLKSVENPQSFDYGDYLRETYNRLILCIAGINKPTIAYLNGTTVGAGLSIALACDYRIAAPGATIALSFLKIGLVPDAGASFFLPRLVGYGKALELSLGHTVSTKDAYDMNLITKTGDPWEFAQTLLSLPAEAYGLMKQNMYKGTLYSLEEVLDMEVSAQRQAGKTDEHKQALSAFWKKTNK
ncbi:enoyl-CoA hydratase/isomerase family protein [Salibacterium salarium]|uniref:enoyl-CoA hydratase/isomerase family protein n=1 Tax=Salibacterium salarium TaxID=284579 RepID=UPI00163B535E|nr:enoyl-CoA hydratase-related protein [Salibacterium salarium]